MHAASGRKSKLTSRKTENFSSFGLLFIAFGEACVCFAFDMDWNKIFLSNSIASNHCDVSRKIIL